MPLSEFNKGTTKGKLESNQSTFMPDNDFVELLWENGQVVMHGQSNRHKRSFIPTPFPSHTLKVQDKENLKFGLFEPIDSSTANDLSPSAPVPSVNIGLHDQDDDTVPWINYPVEDPFCSEFFTELSGINPNSPPNDGDNGFGVKDFHKVEYGHGNIGFKEGRDSTRIRSSQLFQSPQKSKTSVASSRPRVADFSEGVTNFSHFSRPAVLPKANVDDSYWFKRTKETPFIATRTKPMESSLIGSTGVRGNSTVDLAAKEPHCVTEPSVLDGKSRNNNHNNGTAAPEVNPNVSSFAASVATGRRVAEKGPEAAVASSMCSGSSAWDGSSDPKSRQKRKNQEEEDSGYQSEDLEDDSVNVKRPTTARAGVSTKRSRAAEVHNLSERRRRDRINEKMRALQDLIPNCNKVDKASMLDEAIQYLKTLQLQVQIMSMGSGLCMSPMMFPPGMQHIRAPPMAHFSHMGVGMGMGMGYGMGMLDMKGSPGCPFIPLPTMHAPQFAGSTGLQLFGMPGHGQGLTSVPHTQLFSPFAAKGNTVDEVSETMVNPMPVLDIAPSSRCKDLQHQQHSDSTPKASTSDSQALEIGGSRAVINLISDNANTPTMKTSKSNT